MYGAIPQWDRISGLGACERTSAPDGALSSSIRHPVKPHSAILTLRLPARKHVKSQTIATACQQMYLGPGCCREAGGPCLSGVILLSKTLKPRGTWGRAFTYSILTDYGIGHLTSLQVRSCPQEPTPRCDVLSRPRAPGGGRWRPLGRARTGSRG